MRDPAVDLKVAAAIDEAERFLRVRRKWLDATPCDWCDVDKRAETMLRLGLPLRFRFASGRPLGLPDVPTTVQIISSSPEAAELTEDMRAVILKRLAAPALLPRGRGRYQAGAYLPRNAAIVQAINLIRQRGFAAIDSEQKTPKTSAAYIVRLTLKRLGVTLRQRTIENIWKDRRDVAL
jgi:hypothetical protein